jgi:hypothetical protein
MGLNGDEKDCRNTFDGGPKDDDKIFFPKTGKIPHQQL